MTNQDLRQGLDACDSVSQALHMLREAVKTAREPIDNDEWDAVTIRGELTDMREYLHDAQRYNNAVRNSLVQLIALIRRLQVSYSDVYQAYQEALGQIDATYLREAVNVRRFAIMDVAQADLDLILAIAYMLCSTETTESDAQVELREQLHLLLGR